MNKLVKFGCFATTLLLSVASWAFGTSVDLGSIQVPPGYSVLELKSTKLHRNVDYIIRCDLAALNEKSAFAIHETGLRDLDIFVDDANFYEGETIVLKADTAHKIFLRNISLNDSDNAQNILFKNIDQTQTLDIHCVADV